MNPDDELTGLLSERSLLEQLNYGPQAQIQEKMPPEVGAWFGLVGVFLAEKWNNKQYTVMGQELMTSVQQKGATTITSSQWAKAINTFCSAGEGDVFRFLLFTPTSDKFIINQPSLEEFWSSEHIQAFLFLYGGPSGVRSPSGAKEEEWCKWLRSLEKVPQKKKVPVTQSVSSSHPAI